MSKPFVLILSDPHRSMPLRCSKETYPPSFSHDIYYFPIQLKYYVSYDWQLETFIKLLSQHLCLELLVS
jgi:hypothetical protein